MDQILGIQTDPWTIVANRDYFLASQMGNRIRLALPSRCRPVLSHIVWLVGAGWRRGCNSSVFLLLTCRSATNCGAHLLRAGTNIGVLATARPRCKLFIQQHHSRRWLRTFPLHINSLSTDFCHRQSTKASRRDPDYLGTGKWHEWERTDCWTVFRNSFMPTFGTVSTVATIAVRHVWYWSKRVSGISTIWYQAIYQRPRFPQREMKYHELQRNKSKLLVLF